MSRWIALMTLLGGLALAPPARAGTYDVVSCGAPGAGGVNRSWTGRADDPNTEEVADCGSSLFGGSGSGSGSGSAGRRGSRSCSASRAPSA